jgi:multicomponent Na+:H+ antiporter subunit D
VKAGAFGIVRVLYSVFGIEYATIIGVAQYLALAAAVTIVFGSIRALSQDDLKKRLAYSTVSQVSYITLGVATLGPMATLGGLVHLVHQGLMKITLFFCAGNLAEVHGVKKVSEMAGAARRMPYTMAAFTLGAFGMIGLPPTAGFISKLHLGIGGVQAGQPWVVAVLVGSSVLNAAYFLPIIYRAYFTDPDADATRGEAGWLLLAPTLVAAALALGAGLLAAMPFSPLELARLIVVQRYGS